MPCKISPLSPKLYNPLEYNQILNKAHAHNKMLGSNRSVCMRYRNWYSRSPTDTNIITNAGLYQTLKDISNTILSSLS